MKLKRFKKIIALILAVFITANPLVVPVVWAEGESAEQTTPVEQIVPAEQLESAVQTDSTITTGDAAATAEADTTVNTSQDSVPGEITTPEGACTPPEGQTECPGDTTINNSNEATVSGQLEAEATTGDNQTTGATGDASIDSGDATATGTIDSEINSTTVTFEPIDETSAPDSIGAEPEPSPDTPEVTITNENTGMVENEADVSAQTGDNVASENQGEAAIGSGDAVAMANLMTLLNTNIVGSDFEILLLNILADENGDIDLNELWKAILGGGSDQTSQGENMEITVANNNSGDLTNNVNVSADSGGNQANNNGSATVYTGDAKALANVVNLVNTNLFGSKFLFWVINILGSGSFNLILPRPENFQFTPTEGETAGGAVFQNQNQATLNDNVGAAADTGGNQELNNGGINSMSTGDANAVSNSFSIVNLNIFGNNWFYVLINRLGNWQGFLVNWSAPGSVEQQTGVSQSYQLFPEANGGTNSGDSLLTFQNQNQATLQNNIQTTATTGQNQAIGNVGGASIQTGNAWALSNLVNLVNLNILGGRWFFGLLNIMGDWSGNAIFAYPDVSLGLSGASEVRVGETTEYTLSYKNQGYDEALGVKITVELPQGVSFLGDSSGATAQIDGQRLMWDLGQLGINEGGSFQIKVRVNDNFSFDEPISFLSRFVRQADAEGNEKDKEVNVSGTIGTVDPDSNLGNNTSSAQTIVYLPLPQNTETGSNEVTNALPELEITAWNNVGDFVYSGDTLTFEITIKNIGGATSYNTLFVQKLYNGAPEDFGAITYDLGEIEPGKGGKLSFGLKIPEGVPGGPYHTEAQVFGTAPNGTEVVSNTARTDFKIHLNALSSVFAARAAVKEDDVLGASISSSSPKDEEKILPYVLLFVLSSLWLVERGKRAFGFKGKKAAWDA